MVTRKEALRRKNELLNHIGIELQTAWVQLKEMISQIQRTTQQYIGRYSSNTTQLITIEESTNTTFRNTQQQQLLHPHILQYTGLNFSIMSQQQLQAAGDSDSNKGSQECKSS